MMIGGTRNAVTPTALTVPAANPVNSVRTIATGSGTPAFKLTPRMTAARPAMAPVETSMPRVRMTNISPIAINSRNRLELTMLISVVGRRKFGADRADDDDQNAQDDEHEQFAIFHDAVHAAASPAIPNTAAETWSISACERGISATRPRYITRIRSLRSMISASSEEITRTPTPWAVRSRISR